MQPFSFFISYRRSDTAPIALLLKYELEKRIQFARVFVDVEHMQSGDHFPDRLRELIDASHATIALIGDKWMPKKAETAGFLDISSGDAGAPQHMDWVRHELEYSLEHKPIYEQANAYGLEDRRIIPLFVDCEKSFEPFDLPPSLDRLSLTHAEQISYSDWPVAIGPLVEKIAISIGLQKRPDADEYPAPDRGKARTQPIPQAELTEILDYEDYDGWYIDNFGNSDVTYLVKTFKFPHFNQAAEFMRLVSEHCRVLDHHPEWRNVFNHVTVSLSTWDARRQVTIYDLNLALFMNKAAAAVTPDL